jgi:hypothetical protein
MGQFRHTFGFGHPAPPHQENPLPFFSLPPRSPAEHPTMPGGWVTTHGPESVGVCINQTGSIDDFCFEQQNFLDVPSD